MSARNNVIKIFAILVVLAVVAYFAKVITKLMVELLPILAPYSDDVILGINAVIVGIGGFIVVKIVQNVISLYLLSRIERSTAHTISLILNIALYSILVLAVLSALGVNLTGAAIGGAVVGIAIGLAAQTFLSNILSGILVTTSKTLRPGDAVSLTSWIWGSPIIGETEKVDILFTEVRTIYGNVVKIPNSAFLGNTVFTKLEGKNSLTFAYQVTVNADVPAEKVLSLANNYIRDELSKAKLPFPEIYFTNKNGGTNVFSVIIRFQEVTQLNSILDLINRAFDKAYWQAKSG
ncbi:MAG: mechanosensitive ion channel protein MscS [Candidatus Aramenus sulfurataquae]|jgi:small-conductance mechanosensitive channel|uniref:Mechanosensitive ion channel n=2 Tax=Candidatus Aramenus sulfurataquae TaxID=1326980 RepID=W7KUE5_9CREN|nr:MAG: mechanosensitive ion channel protein MscS [Candidatus Aramenus sulfurataquae]MCL7343643.1 mechanosensitive ion channel [Candidatus Aramenus sulfurataquae]